MPTYEYECDACEHRFELFQQMGSTPRKTCPSCKKRKVRRLIGGGAGILFRGSGFYETDNRSADYKKRAEADAKGPTSSGSESSDKKPEKNETSSPGSSDEKKAES